MKNRYLTVLILFSTATLMSCSSLIERLGARDRDTELMDRFEHRRSAALRSRDLIIGMEMSDVARAWGDPADVQIAGDPSRGNQRWLYPTSPSTRWGLGQARIVYFEDGRVAGWETGSTH